MLLRIPNHIEDRAAKLLALALDPAAADGEQRNAAVMFVGALRGAGVTMAAMSVAEQAAPVYCGEIMPFGKYAGRYISEVDDGYLEWLMDEAKLKSRLRRAVQAEARRRWGNGF